MESRIEIRISKTGEVTTVVTGVLGSGCEQKVEWMKAFGQVSREEHTNEYYQEEPGLLLQEGE